MTFEVVDTHGNVERFEEGKGEEWSDEFLEAITDALWVGDIDGAVIPPGTEVTIRRTS